MAGIADPVLAAIKRELQQNLRIIRGLTRTGSLIRMPEPQFPKVPHVDMGINRSDHIVGRDKIVQTGWKQLHRVTGLNLLVSSIQHCVSLFSKRWKTSLGKGNQVQSLKGDSRQCKTLQGEKGSFWKIVFGRDINQAKQATKGRGNHGFKRAF